MEARHLDATRQRILAGYPSRISEIEKRLEDPATPEMERHRLEKELRFCKRGVTGIPSYYPGNARLIGYGYGAVSVVLGVLSLVFAFAGSRMDRPRRKRP